MTDTGRGVFTLHHSMAGGENPVPGKGFLPAGGNPGFWREELEFMYKMTDMKLYRVAKYCGFDNFMKQMLRSSIYIFPDACYNHLEVCEKEHG